MKGNNSLVLNTSTMIDAMQHYLDEVLLQGDVKVKVTGISEDKAACQFHVRVTEIERDKREVENN